MSSLYYLTFVYLPIYFIKYKSQYFIISISCGKILLKFVIVFSRLTGFPLVKKIVK